MQPRYARKSWTTIGTHLLTAIGTLPVLFVQSAPRRLMDAMMGFAAGVMVAASCWSPLVPAVASGGVTAATLGLLAGVAFLYIADQMLPHLHAEFPDEAVTEGPKVAWHRSALLMLAMTLHNFPEGMAVGVSFGGGDLGDRTAAATGRNESRSRVLLGAALCCDRAGRRSPWSGAHIRGVPSSWHGGGGRRHALRCP